MGVFTIYHAQYIFFNVIFNDKIVKTNVNHNALLLLLYLKHINFMSHI